MSSGEEVEERLVRLRPKNADGIPINRKFAMISLYISTSLEQDVNTDEVLIPGVTEKILKLVVEYMEHHKGVKGEAPEKPLRSKKMVDVCKDPWDAQFIETVGKDKQNLYDLILAANYLDISCLLHLGCAKVASLIKGQPLDKIKDLLDPAKAAPVQDDDKKEK